jgi:hypothetical protein
LYMSVMAAISCFAAAVRCVDIVFFMAGWALQHKMVSARLFLWALASFYALGMASSFTATWWRPNSLSLSHEKAEIVGIDLTIWTGQEDCRCGNLIPLPKRLFVLRLATSGAVPSLLVV